MNSTARISSYLKTFHEGPNTNLFWETRLYNLKIEKFIPNISRYALSIASFIILLYSIDLFFAVYYLNETDYLFFIIVLIIAILLALSLHNFINTRDKIPQEYLKAWENLKKLEEENEKMKPVG